MALDLDVDDLTDPDDELGEAKSLADEDLAGDGLELKALASTGPRNSRWRSVEEYREWKRLKEQLEDWIHEGGDDSLDAYLTAIK